MATLENLEELARSISFEIEPIPQDKIHLAGATDKIPLNVKIKVRKKPDCKTAKNAVVAIPKLGRAAQDTVRLVSSDQTIMSFKVFMEDAEQEKLERKVKKSFFGFFKTAGGNPDTEADDTKIDQKLVEDKIETNSIGETTISYKTKIVLKEYKGILGKCKPGGCLDPPFSEERYEYKISNNRRSTSSGKTELKSKVSETTKLSNQTEEIESLKTDNKVVKDNNSELDLKSSSDSILKLYPENKLKSSKDISFSNSIITYPPTQTSSELLKLNADNEKSIKTKNSSEKRMPPFQGSTEIYFPTKKDSKSHKRTKSQSGNKIDSIFNILPIPMNRAQRTLNNVPDHLQKAGQNKLLGLQKPIKDQSSESEHHQPSELENQTDYSRNKEKLIEPYKMSNELPNNSEKVEKSYEIYSNISLNKLGKISTRDFNVPEKIMYYSKKVKENEPFKTKDIHDNNGSKIPKLEADNAPKDPTVVSPLRNLSDTKSPKKEKPNSISSKIPISTKLKESILSHEGGLFKPIQEPQNILTSERDSKKSLHSTKFENSVENAIPIIGLNKATKLRKSSQLNDGSIDIYPFHINETKSEDSFFKPEKAHTNEYFSRTKTYSKEKTQLQMGKINSRPNSANLSKTNQDTLVSSNDKNKRPSYLGGNTENIIKSELRNDSSMKSHVFEKETRIESLKSPGKLNKLKDNINFNNIKKLPASDQTKLNVLDSEKTESQLKLPEHNDQINNLKREQMNTDKVGGQINYKNSVNEEYENDQRQPKISLNLKNIVSTSKTIQIDKNTQKKQNSKEKNKILSSDNTESQLRSSEYNDQSNLKLPEYKDQINYINKEQINTDKAADKIKSRNSVNIENENNQGQPKNSSNLKNITSEPKTMQCDKELEKEQLSKDRDKVLSSENTESTLKLSESNDQINDIKKEQINTDEAEEKIKSRNTVTKYENDERQYKRELLKELFSTERDKINVNDGIRSKRNSKIIPETKQTNDTSNIKQNNKPEYQSLNKIGSDTDRYLLNGNDENSKYSSQIKINLAEKNEINIDKSNEFKNRLGKDSKNIIELKHEPSKDERKMSTKTTTKENLFKINADNKINDGTYQFNNEKNMEIIEKIWKSKESLNNGYQEPMDSKQISEPHQELRTSPKSETQQIGNQIKCVVTTRKQSEEETKPTIFKTNLFWNADTSNETQDKQTKMLGVIKTDPDKSAEFTSNLRDEKAQHNKTNNLRNSHGRLSDLQKDIDKIINDNMVRISRISTIPRRGSKQQDKPELQDPDKHQILNNGFLRSDTISLPEPEPFQKLDLVDSKIEILKPFQNSESNISVNLSFINDNSSGVVNRNDKPVSSANFMKLGEDQIGDQRIHFLGRDAERKNEIEKVITVNKEYFEMIRNSYQKDNNLNGPKTSLTDYTNGIIVLEHTFDKKYNSYDIPTSTNNDDVSPKYNKLSAALPGPKFKENNKAKSDIISIQDKNDNNAMNQEEQNQSKVKTDIYEKVPKPSYKDESKDSSSLLKRKTTSITTSSNNELSFSQMFENKTNENSHNSSQELSDKLESKSELLKTSEYYYSDKPNNLDRESDDEFKQIIPQNYRISFESLDKHKLPQNNEDIISKLSLLESSLETKQNKIQSEFQANLPKNYNKNNMLRETADSSLGKCSSSLNTNNMYKKTVKTYDDKQPGQSQLNSGSENDKRNDEQVDGLLKSAFPFDHYTECVKFQNRNSNRSSAFSSFPEKEMIFFDVSFQSYVNENNQTTFKSVNDVNTIKRYTNDRIMTIKSVVLPNFSKIKVPVDNNNDLIITVLKKDNNETQIFTETDATFLNVKYLTTSNEKSIKEFKKRISIKGVEKSPPSQVSEPGLDKTLSLVYEQQLLPLQSIIQKLKQEINSLTAQQELFRQSVLGTGKPKYIRVTSYMRKCGCHRKHN